MTQLIGGLRGMKMRRSNFPPCFVVLLLLLLVLSIFPGYFIHALNPLPNEECALPGYALPNADISDSSRKTETLAECRNYCQETEGCHAMDWIEPNGYFATIHPSTAQYCYLKTGFGSTGVAVSRPGVIAGGRECCKLHCS